MEAVRAQPAPAQFTPFRGCFWVAVMLYCLGAVLDVLLFHGIAVSSTRKAGQPVSWAATPYTSLRTVHDGHLAKHVKLTASNWYPQDLAISRSGLVRFQREDRRAGDEFIKRITKP